MRYLLGTGRYNVSEQWEAIWRNNAPDVKPAGFACIDVGGNTYHDFDPNHIYLDGNLGHVHDLIPGKSKVLKNHEFCGWSASVMALALIAYNNETDFIYKEQDCLAFGPWVKQMYADLGTGKMIFGRKMKSAPWMPCGQSLFLIKHDFIPDFVCHYLGMGKDGDIHNLPEHKFVAFEKIFGSDIKRLSFGYDRERPINFDDDVWYGQKFTGDEIGELMKRDLI